MWAIYVINDKFVLSPERDKIELWIMNMLLMLQSSFSFAMVNTEKWSIASLSCTKFSSLDCIATKKVVFRREIHFIFVPVVQQQDLIIHIRFACSTYL